MHDAFLKSVFADRRMAEILIRRHAPEWASEIDLSTLREESTGLVSKKTLQRRHPDMIWSADTVEGEKVLFLLEFQRTVERLMALRTTTYTALTLEGVAAGPDYRPGDPLPEFVYLVLARNLSPEDMAGQLSALWRTIEEHGDPGLAGLMGQSVDSMLELRDYPAGLLKGGAKTMAEVVDRFRQGMDELVQKGEVRLMRRLVTRRFGEETAGRLSRLLDELPGPADVDRVTDALVECTTSEEFIERIRMG